MQTNSLLKKGLVVGIIFLFIGIAVAPSINSNVVKTSDDLVEVTSQACGISGFGNTTVKLTKQQYQDLEQYLVDFRARLNQTTTSEEAVSSFKDAVVELDRYGLLPKGMSIEQAQKLVLGIYQNPRCVKYVDSLHVSGKKNSGYSRANYWCLIAGFSSNTIFRGPIFGGLSLVLYYLMALFWPFSKLIATLFNFLWILDMPFGYVISNVIPILVLSSVGLGFRNDHNWQNVPANGWVTSYGFNGFQSWDGDMYGDALDYLWGLMALIFADFYPGILGFSGIKIDIPIQICFYFGYGSKIQINSQY